MFRSRQIAINAVTQSSVHIFGAALGLILVPFLIAKLGKDGYGLIGVTVAIASVCALADLGISGALSRQLSEALANRDNAKYRELLSTALGLNLLMGLTCGLAVFALAYQLATILALPESVFDTGVFLLRTYGVANVVCAFLMPAPQAVLASHNRFDISSKIDAVRRMLQTAGLLLVLVGARAGIAGWASVSIITDAVCTVLLWRAAAKTNAGLRLGISAMSLASFKDLFSLGGQFTIAQLSNQLSVTADPFILTACLGPASVSLYRPPGQVFSALSSLVLTLANQLSPLATKAHVERDGKDLTAILFRGTKYTMLMGSVCCGLVIALAHPLCKLWLSNALGEQYAICATVLEIHAVTQLAVFAGGTQWAVLLGIRRTAFAAYGRLALAVVNIVSSWLLVRYTALGVLGVVLPTMMIELAWRPVLIRHVCRALNIAVSEYLKQSYLMPLLVGGATAAVGFAAVRFASPTHFWSLVATAVCLVSFGSVLTWLVGFNPTDRTAMIRVAQLAREFCSSTSGSCPTSHWERPVHPGACKQEHEAL